MEEEEKGDGEGEEREDKSILSSVLLSSFLVVSHTNLRSTPSGIQSSQIQSLTSVRLLFPMGKEKEEEEEEAGGGKEEEKEEEGMEEEKEKPPVAEPKEKSVDVEEEEEEDPVVLPQIEEVEKVEVGSVTASEAAAEKVQPSTSFPTSFGSDAVSIFSSLLLSSCVCLSAFLSLSDLLSPVPLFPCSSSVSLSPTN